MHRTIFATVFTAALLAATAVGAGEIPSRPESLTFPDLTFSVPDADSARFELANGTPVYAITDPQFPLVNLTLYFRGGRYLVPAGKEGLAAVAGEAWRTGGAGERTAQELDEELDFLAAVLNAGIGDVTGSVSLNVLAKDLPAAMQLFMDVVTAPRFQADRFAKAKDDLLQAMKRRNDDSAQIEAREWDRLIYGDEYWMNRLATKASVDALTPQDCASFLASLIRAGNVVVAVAGDIAVDDAKVLLEASIGTLPPLEQPLPPIPQPEHTPEPGVYVVDKADVNQGRVRIGHLGFRLGHPQEFALRIGNDILGGGSSAARMMKRIRSDEGLAYSAYSNCSFPVTMPGVFNAFFQTKSSTVPFATRLAFDLIRQMQKKPPTADELDMSQTSFVETFPRRFESAAQTAGLFAIDEILGRPHAYWAGYRDRISAVSGEAVRAALADNLEPKSMVVLVVGNLAEILQGHPDHEEELADFGAIHRVPLRDPMTLGALPQ